MNYNTGFQHSGKAPYLTPLSEEKYAGTYQLWQLSTRVIASIALMALLPLFACIWVINQFTSKGPLLFKQTRPGLNGESFQIYKLRTMYVGSEAQTALGTKNNGSAVTPIGQILRKLKIDETPQLFNVARGEMAVVGPRPIPEQLDQKLRESIPGFAARYRAKPGLTSIGQICVHENGLDEELINDWSVRFEGELHYIRNRSVSYELVMIMMTSFYVIKKLFSK